MMTKSSKLIYFIISVIFFIISGTILIICSSVNFKLVVGFISLFKYDGDERIDLTPWYATMYVKKEYRGKGYSKKGLELLCKKAFDDYNAKVLYIII